MEDNFSYPISFNGKTRMLLEFPIALSKEEVEAQVLANPEVQATVGRKGPEEGDRGAQADRQYCCLDALRVRRVTCYVLVFGHVNAQHATLQPATSMSSSCAVERTDRHSFCVTRGMARSTTVVLTGLAPAHHGLRQSDRPHGSEAGPLEAMVASLRTLDHNAFKPGEKLTYVVHYGWVNAGEAIVELKESAREIQGRKVLGGRR